MPEQTTFARQLTKFTAIATTLLGAIVFLGWVFDVEPMRRGFISHIHMLPNTSAGFILAGVALWLVRHPDTGPASRKVSAVLALIVALLGTITFLERMTNWNAGIDLLLFPSLVQDHPYRPPGRMVANSALTFALSGMGLLTVDRTMGHVRLGTLFGLPGLVIALVALVGYLYQAPVLYLGDQITGMALVTALSFFSLNLGLVSARPSKGMNLLFGRSQTARISRRQVAALVLIPLLLGKLIIMAREELLVSREVAVALLVVATMVVLVVVTMATGIAVDAGETSREQALAREAAARQEAEAAFHAKNDFLAVMSHELRTPLNAIIGYSSLLQEGIPEPLSEGQRRQVERITSSARHLLALIDEVLMLSRMELGEEQFEAANVNVRRLMEESASMVEPQARARGLVFVLEPPPPDLYIQSDANRLRQALLNVLGNAVKFTEAGTVTFRAEVEHGNDVLRFDIEDTGPGIASEHLERVFESFWQVDQAKTRRAGGVGLGLYVTRQVIRLLGGDVSVRSTMGKGSCFSIRLPRHWWGATTAEFPRVTPMSTEVASAVPVSNRPTVSGS